MERDERIQNIAIGCLVLFLLVGLLSGIAAIVFAQATTTIFSNPTGQPLDISNPNFPAELLFTSQVDVSNATQINIDLETTAGQTSMALRLKTPDTWYPIGSPVFTDGRQTITLPIPSDATLVDGLYFAINRPITIYNVTIDGATPDPDPTPNQGIATPAMIQAVQNYLYTQLGSHITDGNLTTVTYDMTVPNEPRPVMFMKWNFNEE